VTDDLDRAQRILEGKCPECCVPNPKHTMTCSLNPYRQALEQLATLKYNTREVYDKCIEYANYDPEQFVELLKEFKDRKNNDV